MATSYCKACAIKIYRPELIVYKGFGHGITKPKERLAATWHNWQWFNKYVWGEKIELPVGEKK
jgi:hypothetical protein